MQFLLWIKVLKKTTKRDFMNNLKDIYRGVPERAYSLQFAHYTFFKHKFLKIIDPFKDLYSIII